MKRTTKVVTRFDVDEEFYVEVIPCKRDNENWLEFTLCKENHGMKVFMFGVLEEDFPEEKWEEMIEANVDSHIESFEHDMELFEAVYEMELEVECEDECEYDCCGECLPFCDDCKCSDCGHCEIDGCCDCEKEPSIYEAIEIHNEHVESMQDLAECLMNVYPHCEETAVNDAFCKAYNGLVGNAIFLCCEANNIDGGKWMTTEDWYVVEKDDEEVEG